MFVEVTLDLQDDNTIVLRSVEPATTAATGTEFKKLSRTHSHAGPAGANESGIESALPARATRRQRQQFDRTKLGAHKALHGLKFISGSRANSWAEVQRNFDRLAKDKFISRSDFAQCIGMVESKEFAFELFDTLLRRRRTKMNKIYKDELK